MTPRQAIAHSPETVPLDTPAVTNDGEPTGGALDTYLGRTGLEISRLALGTVNFGGRVEEPDARALLDHALDARK